MVIEIADAFFHLKHPVGSTFLDRNPIRELKIEGIILINQATTWLNYIIEIDGFSGWRRIKTNRKYEFSGVITQLPSTTQAASARRSSPVHRAAQADTCPDPTHLFPPHQTIARCQEQRDLLLSCQLIIRHICIADLNPFTPLHLNEAITR